MKKRGPEEKPFFFFLVRNALHRTKLGQQQLAQPPIHLVRGHGLFKLGGGQLGVLAHGAARDDVEA
jgi:hypothetical protein